MYIKQVQTSACETIYEIEREGETYRLHLRIIVGGTPVLSFSNSGHGSKRFAVTDEARRRWQAYPRQGPTFNEVLPNGTEDLLQFLDEFIPKRAQAIAEEKERKQLRDWDLPPRNTWPEYEPEPQPRVLLGRLRPDGGWVVQGRDIVKVLKRARGAISFGNIILNPTLLRQYANILRKDWLIVYPANGDEQLRIRTADDDSNRATIKHGAREKYHGLNGFSAQVILRERN